MEPGQQWIIFLVIVPGIALITLRLWAIDQINDWLIRKKWKRDE